MFIKVYDHILHIHVHTKHLLVHLVFVLLLLGNNQYNKFTPSAIHVYILHSCYRGNRNALFSFLMAFPEMQIVGADGIDPAGPIDTVISPTSRVLKQNSKAKMLS